MSENGTATTTDKITMSEEGTAIPSIDNTKMSGDGAAATSADKTKTPDNGTASSLTENKHISDEETDPSTNTKTEEEEEEYTDVLGNKTLLKKIITPGSGKKPERGERLSVTIQRSIPEIGKEFPEEDVTFVLGDCDLDQAFDLVIALMKVRERATVAAGYRYMFGEMGCEPDVPPFANFKLDIHLKENHGVPDYNAMSLEERYSIAKAKKERGNFYYRREEFGQSIYVYSKAIKVMDPNEGFIYPDAAPEILQEILEFRGVLLANISVAQLKFGSTDAAIKSAIEATKLCPTYSKAFFRLGQAYEKKGMKDEAIKSLKLALKNDPDNSKVIHTELSRITKANKESKQAEIDMYGKMFWGSKPPGGANSKKPKVEDNASLNDSPIATTSSHRSPQPVMAPDWYFTKQQALAKAQLGAFSYSTDLDSGETNIEAEIVVEPVVDKVDAFEEERKASWFTNPLMWGTIGAGLAGAASLGLYKYFH